MKIRFATDSVGDVSPEFAAAHGVAVVPCYVNFGGESYKDDGVELVREDYYNRLASLTDHPSTSAMSPDLVRGFIDELFEDADHLIMITTPAKLSGIYNAFRQGSAHLPQDRVTLIDSGQLSAGMAFQVMVGVEVAEETGSLTQTLMAIHAVKDNQKVYATIGSMEFLRRSGRVGWATASIGTLLNIKPVIQLEDGVVKPIARVRTFAKSLEKLAELARQHAPFDRVTLLHVNNPEGVEELRGLLSDILPENMPIELMSPSLGTHIGPGSVGIGTLSKGWKDALSA